MSQLIQEKSILWDFLFLANEHLLPLLGFLLAGALTLVMQILSE